MHFENLSKKKNSKKEFTNEDLVKIWDEYAKVYDRLMLTPLFKDNSKKFLNSLLLCFEGIIHDGGCGTGYWLKDILDKTQARKIIATDFSSEMLEKAAEKISKLPKVYQEKIELRRMDLTKKWPEETFDAQIFQQLANYLPWQGWNKIIEMAYQTLRPRGYIYSSTYLKGFNIKNLARKHTLEQMIGTPLFAYPALLKSSKILSAFDKLEEKSIIQLPSKKEYLSYHKKVGFKNIEITGEITWGAGIIVRAQK